ncbi:FAD binding domain-containing protein [Kitasatospora cheerisanensis]|uniref:Putative xanthine dehydrogenase YagS FAD-binding subunit n=1 Tax=Kitasatospora cheerisanensis KCTC 2395 TaxID=1348663 RepID=A0A066Z0H0_9ACTN|nr:xanthine dehydrogenase family protein subunit M [Kitasatospora cheerisanensis]KDN83841.1 putative xanthine dehydrogenase YagS FAD-binding subunit [Kitasatospora cheerisanensis KCTC 2395]
MRPFDYAAPRTVEEALAQHADGAAYLAGGTSLVDLMKLDVARPHRVVDVNSLPLHGVTTDERGLHLSALERLGDLARHPAVADGHPVLRQALLASASPQLRNMATIGGNLLQRTRCGYFRDTAAACNKREPGSGCAARTGDNRGHAVLGAGPSCVATHPSDPAVALSALDALLELHGADGVREVPLNSFYRLPGETPQTETVLRPGELITRVTVPPLPGADRSVYVKVRDRRSYEFALVSAAVAVDLHDGEVRGVRIALGGVAPRPWRAHAAEQALTGREFTRANALEAAAAAADGAEPLSGNAFKIELVRRTVGHALTRLGGR